MKYLSRNKINKTVAIIAAVIAALLISGIVYLGYMNIPTSTDSVIPDHLSDISPITSVVASSYSGSDITTDCKLKVTTKEAMSKKAFSEAFSIYPTVEYKVKKTSGNTFSVYFEEPLLNDTVYKISSMHGSKSIYSWAFQTSKDFTVCKNNVSNGYVSQNSPITIEFSHSNVENFEENFSIFPSVSGTFAHNEKKWTFIPSVEYEKDVLYTVTLSKEITGGSSEALKENYSFTFSLEPTIEDSYVKLLNTNQDKIDCFTTKDNPIATFLYKNTELSKADVSVYRIDSTEDFISLHKRHVSSDFISNAINSEFENAVKSTIFTASFEHHDGKAYLRYPQTFENGYYVSEITTKNTRLYHIFQVTDMAVYTVSSNNDHTVWVNSTNTGDPVVSATVTLDGFKKTNTDAKGLASFDNLDCDSISSGYLTVSANTLYHTYVTKIPSTEHTEHFTSGSYISTSLSDYSPSDAVKVWGFTTRKLNNSPLFIYDSANNKYHDVTVDESGYFEIDIALPNALSEKSNYVSLFSGENELATTDFSVNKSDEGIYRLEITTDKYAYYSGETIEYTVKSYFSDGTPAPNIDIIYYGDMVLTTDENATATFSKLAKHSKNSVIPESSTQAFYVRQPNGILSEYFNECVVFSSELWIDAEKLTTSDGETIHISLNSIDESLFDNGVINANLSASANFTDKAADASILAELHKISYEKEVSDSVYQPLTDSDRDVYRYSENDQVISSQEISVKNGVADIPIPDFETDASKYYYTFTVTDSEDRESYTTLYIYDNSPTESKFEYTLSTDKKEYAENETVNLNVIKDESIVEDGSLILTFINGDIIKSEIYSDISKVDFEFEKSFNPNVYVQAAVFDGNAVKPLEPTVIYAVKEQLDINISADKSSYESGEKVTLDITAKDCNGNPVSACVAVNVKNGQSSPKYPELDNIYSSIYQSKTSKENVFTTISTHDIFDESANNEQNVDAVSVLYKDTYSIFFEKITTSQDGKATVSFTLPKDPFDWIITADGFTSDLTVGSAQLNISAIKDFYISAITPTQAKSSDDTVVNLSFVAKDSIVDDCVYSMTLYKNDSLVDTFNSEALINQTLSHSYGKLESGDYKIRITAKCGFHTAAQDFSFSVCDSYSQSKNKKNTLLEYEYSLNPDDFDSDVVITLYDEELEFSKSVLEKLSVLSGNTFEKSLVANEASANIKGESAKNSGYDISSFQNYTIDRIALITDSFPEHFDKKQLITYLNDAIYTVSSDTDKLYCYYALASLGQPVLNELEYYNDKLVELNDEQRLCLALAYASIGDKTNAYSIFEKSILPRILTANGISRIDSNTSSKDTVRLTALAVNLTSKISAVESKNLVKYLLADEQAVNEYCDVLFNFSINYTPTLEGEHEITIRYADGKKESLKFNRTEPKYITLSKDMISGTVFNTDSETCMISVIGKKNTEELKTKLQKADNSDYISAYINETPNKDKTFDININLSLSEEYNTEKQITLLLPYSFKYISNDLQNEYGYCTHEGSKITVEYFADNLSFNIKCYATEQGDFTIEPITITDIKNSKFISSANTNVIIEKNNRED